MEVDTLSVIRQKGESQNGCFKKTKHAKFSEKRTFLTPWYAHVRVYDIYQATKNNAGKNISSYHVLPVFLFVSPALQDRDIKMDIDIFFVEMNFCLFLKVLSVLL